MFPTGENLKCKVINFARVVYLKLPICLSQFVRLHLNGNISSVNKHLLSLNESIFEQQTHNSRTIIDYIKTLRFARSPPF
jgi:hypothetical protein